MDQVGIEASLRRIDKKFTEQLSKQEKKKAYHQFKKVYAQQMAKIASQVSKRQKVQSNLNSINQKEVGQSKSINASLNKKMEKHGLNLEKYKDNKIKEFKMMDENWKRKLEEIQRKKKIKQREAFQETQKIRKQAEQYWRKKQDRNFFRSTNKDQNQRSESKNSSGLFHSIEKSANRTSIKKLSMLLPQLQMNKTKPDKSARMASQSLDEDIKIHKERCIKTHLDKQQEKFQSFMMKLEKINQTRKNVQNRVEKQISQSKRMRQLRQNPQRIAMNRQKSIETLHSKSKSKSPGLRKEKSKFNLEGGKKQLDKSIYSHLQTKKKLVELEFLERESVYETKLKKLKSSKINRMVKQAINYIKLQTLHNTD